MENALQIAPDWPESQLPEHEQAAILEFAYDAVIGCTRTGIVKVWNAGATRLFGYTAAEMIGRPVSLLAEQTQAKEQEYLIREACSGRRAGPIETTRRHRGGTTMPVELVLMPVEDAHGQVVMLAATIRDISARKRAEILRETMVDELTHRIANTIATVRALAALSLRSATSLESFGTTFGGRLQSLVATHAMMTRNAWQGATLRTLINTELAPYESPGIPKWSLAGDDVALDSRRAVAFSMVLHELTTNAMKYGALSTGSGHIQISWRIAIIGGLSRFQLTWAETGGPAVIAPTRMGVGRRLLTGALAAELDGSVELVFDPAGVRCDIDVPLEPVKSP